MLTDNHGRNINYLRLAVTDRCNLRCLYCMPEKGLKWEPRDALLSFEEIIRLLRITSSAGITKIRFTGGEPFLRKDFMILLRSVVQEQLFTNVSITTNGTFTHPHISELRELGISGINLSIDTLDEHRFRMMTRRDDLSAVRQTLDGLLAAGIPTRINAVIMEGKNEQDIYELAALTQHQPVDVRFIEEMPFNGSGIHSIRWTYAQILQELQKYFKLVKVHDEEGSTSLNYSIPGHRGSIGVIPAFTRSFCGSCNRLRITPAGLVKTCLYGHAALDLRQLLRGGKSDDEILGRIRAAVGNRFANGFEAEAARAGDAVHESMATIGG